MTSIIERAIRGYERRKIAGQMIDLLALLSNALSAGVSLAQAFEMASMESPQPLGRVLKSLVGSVKVGRSLEDALEETAGKWPVEEMIMLSDSVSVLKKTGGNLVEVFSRLSSTARERKKVQDRIKILTAQGVYQGFALCLTPFLLALALHAISPNYIDPLFSTAIGRKMIALGIGLEFVGAAWMRKMVSIRV